MMVCFYKENHLPWDKVALAPFQIDSKDPEIFQKTMQYEADVKQWESDYVSLKFEVYD
jgi:hypothetical protein